MNQILVVVDMQQDFITGTLGTLEAQQIVPNVLEMIRNFQGKIFYTQDTHGEEYLTTQEGKLLPVKHCVKGTDGWKLQPDIERLLQQKGATGVEKDTFGSITLMERLQKAEPDSITFVGVCTDICVVSNAVSAKMYFPDIPISVLASACAGSTPKKQQEAISVLQSCQILIEGVE